MAWWGGGNRKGRGPRRVGPWVADTFSWVCSGCCTSWASVPILGARVRCRLPSHSGPAEASLPLTEPELPAPSAKSTGPAVPWARLTCPSGLPHTLAWGLGLHQDPRSLPGPGATQEDVGQRSGWKWGSPMGSIFVAGQRLLVERLGDRSPWQI